MPLRFAALLALALLAACRVDDAPPDDAGLVRSDSLVEFTPDTSAAPAAACVLVAVDSVALRARPDPTADAAGALAPGDSARVEGRAPGWLALGADRWADADGPFALRGACARLPAVPPTGCAATAADTLRLYARPDTAASVVAVVPHGGAAEVVSRTSAGWVRVRLPADAAAPGPPGWLAPGTARLAGPDCAAR